MKRSLLHNTRLLTRWQSSQASVEPTEKSPGSLLPFNKIPSPPAWPLLGHLPLLAKEENRTGLVKFWKEIYQQYGDIVRFKLPGKNLLFLFNPEYFKVMHRNEPRIPHIEEFELFSYIREQKLKYLYPSSGLITNAETWYRERHAVQQDMLRPSSALYYIPDIEAVAQNYVQAVRADRDHRGMCVHPCSLHITITIGVIPGMATVAMVIG